MLLLAQLVAISDVRRERNKYEAFSSKSEHSLPMSSFFPWGSQGERGQKCSVFLLGQIKSRKPLPVLGKEFPTEFEKPKQKIETNLRLFPTVWQCQSIGQASSLQHYLCTEPYILIATDFSDNSVRGSVTARPGCGLHAFVCRCQVFPHSPTGWRHPMQRPSVSLPLWVESPSATPLRFLFFLPRVTPSCLL